jgi:dTDP-4-dehydrorhamnose 3,5-epimerase-like enzyme
MRRKVGLGLSGVWEKLEPFANWTALGRKQAMDVRATSIPGVQVLPATEGEQLFQPHGSAHGFCTLEPNTEVAYKVDDYYASECDAGLIWNDPDLGIDWPIIAQETVLSEKDAKLPRLCDFQSPFAYTERK